MTNGNAATEIVTEEGKKPTASKKEIEDVFAKVAALNAHRQSYETSIDELEREISGHLNWLKNQLGATFQRAGLNYQIRKRGEKTYMVATAKQFGRRKGSVGKKRAAELSELESLRKRIAELEAAGGTPKGQDTVAINVPASENPTNTPQ